jgi:hypothetical protein
MPRHKYSLYYRLINYLFFFWQAWPKPFCAKKTDKPKLTFMILKNASTDQRLLLLAELPC